jgi:hypothetical protein
MSQSHDLFVDGIRKNPTQRIFLGKILQIGDVTTVADAFDAYLSELLFL